MHQLGIPALIVFDLDLTLWNCGGLWVDCTSPPYHKSTDGKVWDSRNREMRLYEDIPAILDHIDQLGCEKALASRTEQPEWARAVLQQLGYQHRFDYQQIFPGSKVTHFQNLQQDTGLSYSEMLFFDDELRNITEVGALGVKCVEAVNGVDWTCFESGLALF